MATPNAAIPRDLEQRLRILEANMRTLTGASLRRRQLGVSSGDFVVSGGGSVLVQNDDLSGIELAPSGVLSSLWLKFYLAGWPSYNYGSITVENSLSGANPVGSVMTFSPPQRSLDDRADLQLRTADGSALPFVEFGVGQTGLQIMTPNNQRTDLAGGAGSAFGGYTSRLCLGSNFWVGARDGANGTYIPMRASSFDVNSSAEVKAVAGDLEHGALDKVRAVSIKRWRYKTAPGVAPAVGRAPVSLVKATAKAAPATEAPEQIGPLAEDVPADIGNPNDPDPENRTVSVSSSLWLLWKATQELAATVDTQAAQIEALTARLAALEGKS